MEPPEQPSSTSTPERPSPSREGKLRRILSDMQGLVDDLRTWIDLRLDLAILEVEEQIDQARNEIALGVVLALFGFFAVFFSLTTVALGVGWLLGHPFWGFLAVSIALLLIVGALRYMQPALVPPSNLLHTLRGKQGAGKQEAGEQEVGEQDRPSSPSPSSEEQDPARENVSPPSDS